MDLVARGGPGGVGLAVDRLDAHPRHERRDVQPAQPDAFCSQQVTQHAGASKRIIQMHLIDPAHERQII